MLKKLTEQQFNDLWTEIDKAADDHKNAVINKDAVALYKAHDIVDVAVIRLRKHFAAIEVEKGEALERGSGSFPPRGSYD